jgi:CRISPR-associated protein Cmr4
MNIIFYKIECLTNLHVGSGEINYNIIDKEVEKDAVTGLPVIHASGIKGALRDSYPDKAQVAKIFGEAGDGEEGRGGTHKFLDAFLLSRPMRVSGSSKLSAIPVVTVDSVNRFLNMLTTFGKNTYGVTAISAPDFSEDVKFLYCHSEKISVEGDKSAELKDQTTINVLKAILGESFAVAAGFDEYPLPVVARNCLQKGKENLWYEEVVPHDSVMYFAIIGDTELSLPEIVQFGGNASIGCGYCKVSKIENGKGAPA